MNCTRCDGSGFLNLDQIPDAEMQQIDAMADDTMDRAMAILGWMYLQKTPNDVCICDCCGDDDGENWHFEPGVHAEFLKYPTNGGVPPCI